MLVLVAASGCTTIESVPDGVLVTDSSDPAWVNHVRDLSRLNKWNTQGRLALTTSEESVQLDLRWQRQLDKHQIDMSGPLGHGHVRVEQDSQGARLIDANQQTFYDGSIESILYKAVGWRVPLDNMVFWVRGLPVPNVEKKLRLDAFGRLQVLEQDGWTIQFLDYVKQGELMLPRKLFMKTLTDKGEGFLEARMVIGRWDIGE